jgi:phosphoribosylanthranilate isomerase
MKPFKIKVCGMRDPENISGVVNLGPDYIGLIFYRKSKRYVPDSSVNDIVNAVPPEIKKVGVFVNELTSEIIRKINLFKLDIIQLHGDEPPQYCLDLKDIGLTVIKSFGIDNTFNFDTLAKYENACDYFLFDSKSPAYGGTGNKFDWSVINGHKFAKPVFLSGGIGPDDAEKLMKSENTWIHSIDINSKFEKEPALKDIHLLKQFFQQIK